MAQVVAMVRSELFVLQRRAYVRTSYGVWLPATMKIQQCLYQCQYDVQCKMPRLYKKSYGRHTASQATMGHRGETVRSILLIRRTSSILFQVIH